ncbi:hypothetical protein Mycsm_06700 (plasmid) [Mycobacterium sp. JS623]|nr:hypothetical protein Mycsm_06700 [Mycobacterium sp. JS623]
MSEQERIIQLMRTSAVIDAIRWAFTSAKARTLEDYSEDAGYDAAWLGSTRFALFRDRLDRVFSCGRYEVRRGAEPTAGLDLVHAELTKQDVEAMPVLPHDRVRRADLNKSPGWALAETRLLLASSAFGDVDHIPWPQKSRTKQLVAKQGATEPAPSLFDELPEDEVGGLAEALAEKELDLDTYVVAHSLDPVSEQAELVLGRPRSNDGGGTAWHWRENLLGQPPSGGNRQSLPQPPSPPDSEPDAVVRLRIAPKTQSPRSASGQR